MGESTCVMHAFSYTSGISNDTTEGNQMYGLGDSISFGRFASETLSWEKWSTFTRNRYVDEAKSYSKPGSVAQKKAYFEAHFKRMAALKAAALLEQQQASSNNNNHNHNDDHSAQGGSLKQLNGQVEVDNYVEEKFLSSESGADESSLSTQSETGDQESVHGQSTAYHQQPDFEAGENISSIINAEAEEHSAVNSISDPMYVDQANVQITEVESSDCSPPGIDYGNPRSSIGDVEGKDLATEVGSMKNIMDSYNEHVQIEGESLGVAANHSEPIFETAKTTMSTEDVGDQTAQVGPRTDLVDTNHESGLVEGERSSGVTANHSETCFKHKENISSIKDDEGEAQTGTLMGDGKCSSSIADQGVAKAENSSSQDALSTVLVPKKNPPLSSFIHLPEAGSSVLGSPSSSPARSVVPQQGIDSGKENCATLTGRKPCIDETDKRRTPLRMSINREINRFISPVIKKIGRSSKLSNKDCPTPSVTPANKASMNSETKNPSLATPRSGRRRARVLFDSSAGEAKVVGPRWQFLNAEGSKSPSISSRNKANSPITSSFCLRSREKTQKRKEGIADINKIRQSFCFGARLSSESFRERERTRTRPVDNNKMETTNQHLPEKGRSRMQIAQRSSLKAEFVMKKLASP